MPARELVSAIVTTCERPRLVGRAIDSVFSQTYRPIECIVVNDGADEATRHVLSEKLKQYPTMRIIDETTRRGLSAARNAGMEAARGDYVAFLDDDDVWLPAKIEKQVERMHFMGDRCGLIYTWFEFRRGVTVVSTRRPTLEGSIFQHLIVSQPLGNGSTLLLRRDAALAIGGFDLSLPRGIDGDFIRRLALDWLIAVTPEVLTWLYVGHEYERITTDNHVGLQRALHSHRVKLTKFPVLIDQFPTEKALLYQVIAWHEASLGEAPGAMRTMIAGLMIRPFSIRVWRRAASVCRALLSSLIASRRTG